MNYVIDLFVHLNLTVSYFKMFVQCETGPLEISKSKKCVQRLFEMIISVRALRVQCPQYSGVMYGI